MKACSTCKESLALFKFSKSSKTKSGLQAQCKACMSIARKKHYSENKEWYKKQHKEWYTKNRESHNAKAAERYFSITFGLTSEQYTEIMSKADKCDLCLVPFNGNEARLDHCHETGKIRGVLCNNCNLALGLLKDNKQTIERILPYLDK